MKERGKRTQDIAIAGGKGSEVEREIRQTRNPRTAVASGSAVQPALVQQAPERYACGWSAF